jgi:ubiquinone/menaquinone biosynthesis C-methylase UbiE
MDSKLKHTGERFIEECYKDTKEDYLIYLFHMVTYKFCLPYAKGKKVLDFGCGSGYGTSLISSNCLSVVGVDVSENAIAYSEKKHSSSNLSFKKIEKTENNNLPFKNEEFDLVLSLQVIEHIKDTNCYLSEIKRVLKNNGMLILVTPDRKTRLLPFQKPWNKYHVKEYSTSLLYDTLTPYFSDIKLFWMSGTKNKLRVELERTRSIRLVMLPFTFPCAPEWWRVAGISFVKWIRHAILKTIKKKATEDRTISYGFDESDIYISKSVLYDSVNIIAVAKNSSKSSHSIRHNIAPSPSFV